MFFDIEASEDYEDIPRLQCCSRKICLARKGFLGLAPAAAQDGDVIGIVVGVRVPLLIRETMEASELIEDAYVEGMMYDEARAME